jgi:hypothetical protein
VPSVSKKQHNFMATVAKNPGFAKKVGIPRSVGEEFLTADKGKKFREGGTMKHSDMSKDKPMMKKIAGLEATKVVNKHEKKMHGMAKGGVTRADGCVSKGHTKGKMIKMMKGGAC